MVQKKPIKNGDGNGDDNHGLIVPKIEQADGPIFSTINNSNPIKIESS